MPSKQHWYEQKNKGLIDKQTSLKEKAKFTSGSGNQRADNDIIITLDNGEVIQIEVKWLETRSKSGNINIVRRDWNHVEEQSQPFNIPVIIRGHSRLELAVLKPVDLFKLLNEIDFLHERNKTLESKINELTNLLEESDAD